MKGRMEEGRWEVWNREHEGTHCDTQCQWLPLINTNTPKVEVLTNVCGVALGLLSMVAAAIREWSIGYEGDNHLCKV